MLQKSYQMKYFDKMKHLFAAIEHSFRKKVVLLREILRVRKKMFEPTATYSPISSSGMTSYTGMSSSHSSSSFVVSTSLGSSFSSGSYSSSAPISVRTSDKTFRSISTGGTFEYVLPKGVGSFVAMHKEVSSSIGSPITSLPLAYAEGDGSSTGPGGRPGGGGATGELDPDFASPVGDVLLPMLLMAGVYAIVKWFKRRKFQKSLSI